MAQLSRSFSLWVFPAAFDQGKPQSGHVLLRHRQVADTFLPFSGGISLRLTGMGHFSVVVRGSCAHCLGIRQSPVLAPNLTEPIRKKATGSLLTWTTQRLSFSGPSPRSVGRQGFPRQNPFLCINPPVGFDNGSFWGLAAFLKVAAAFDKAECCRLPSIRNCDHILPETNSLRRECQPRAPPKQFFRLAQMQHFGFAIDRFCHIALSGGWPVIVSIPCRSPQFDCFQDRKYLCAVSG